MTQTNLLNADAMESSIVSAKGQVVIPKRIRAMLHMKPGTRVYFEARASEIVLTPVTPRYFEHMAGFLGTGGKATKALLEERKQERAL